MPAVCRQMEVFFSNWLEASLFGSTLKVYIQTVPEVHKLVKKKKNFPERSPTSTQNDGTTVGYGLGAKQFMQLMNQGKTQI